MWVYQNIINHEGLEMHEEISLKRTTILKQYADKSNNVTTVFYFLLLEIQIKPSCTVR